MVYSVQSMVLYRVFPFVLSTLVSELKTRLCAAFHLQVTDAKVAASLQFVTSFTVQTVVIGVMEHSESW